jgi:hypothetical protein
MDSTCIFFGRPNRLQPRTSRFKTKSYGDRTLALDYSAATPAIAHPMPSCSATTESPAASSLDAPGRWRQNSPRPGRSGGSSNRFRYPSRERGRSRRPLDTTTDAAWGPAATQSLRSRKGNAVGNTRNHDGRKSGSLKTRRWREMDSNPRSPVRTDCSFETASCHLGDDPHSAKAADPFAIGAEGLNPGCFAGEAGKRIAAVGGRSYKLTTAAAPASIVKRGR